MNRAPSWFNQIPSEERSDFGRPVTTSTVDTELTHIKVVDDDENGSDDVIVRETWGPGQDDWIDWIAYDTVSGFYSDCE